MDDLKMGVFKQADGGWLKQEVFYAPVGIA